MFIRISKYIHMFSYTCTCMYRCIPISISTSISTFIFAYVYIYIYVSYPSMFPFNLYSYLYRSKSTYISVHIPGYLQVYVEIYKNDTSVILEKCFMEPVTAQAKAVRIQLRSARRRSGRRMQTSAPHPNPPSTSTWTSLLLHLWRRPVLPAVL